MVVVILLWMRSIHLFPPVFLDHKNYLIKTRFVAVKIAPPPPPPPYDLTTNVLIPLPVSLAVAISEVPQSHVVIALFLL